MIDAHQHFWQLGRNDCTWPTPDLTPIHRDFGPAQWAPLAAAAGVRGSVLVQSQPSDRDTDYLLRIAATEPSVLAVVGWADLAADDAVARIESLARHPKLRGLRPMLQNIDDDAWINRPELEPAVAAMTRLKLRFDALVYTRHLPQLQIFAQRHPRLQLVIDHAAKPPIATREAEPWRAAIRDFAVLPNVCCKLSGLLTEAGPAAGAAELAPYVRHLLAVFGAPRLMWGSDWPVLELAGRYSHWLTMARELCAGLSEQELAAVFGETARWFYRI